MENLFSIAIFVQICLSGLVICTIAYQLAYVSIRDKRMVSVLNFFFTHIDISKRCRRRIHVLRMLHWQHCYANISPVLFWQRDHFEKSIVVHVCVRLKLDRFGSALSENYDCFHGTTEEAQPNIGRKTFPIEFGYIYIGELKIAYAKEKERSQLKTNLLFTDYKLCLPLICTTADI